MRPRNKGDFYDKPNSYTFLQLRPARSRLARVRPARVRPARVRPAGVRPAKVRPARVRPLKNEAGNGVRPKSIIIVEFPSRVSIGRVSSDFSNSTKNLRCALPQ